MNAKRTILLVNTLYLTAYLVLGTIYYVTAGETLGYEEHPVFASLYLGLVLAHAGIVALGVLLQWWGYAARKSGPLVLASLLYVVAGVELILLVYPALAMIVAIVLNVIAGKPKPAAGPV
jgi:hypothetical protein